MSSWTDGEVLQLKKAGNDVCRQTWLAKAPPIGTNGRPKEGDDINVFKAFVVNAYERKMYFSPGGGDASPPPPPTPPRQQQQQPLPSTRTAVAPVRTAPTPAPASVDLFSFDAAPSISSTPTPAAANDFFAPTATTATGATPMANDPFAAAPSSINTNNNTQSFANFASPAPAPIPPVAAAPATFDPFTLSGGSNTNQSTAVPPANDFGDFASAAPAPAAKKPIMNSANAGGLNSNTISSMGGMMAPSPQQQQQMRMMAMQQQQAGMGMPMNGTTMQMNPAMGMLPMNGGMNATNSMMPNMMQRAMPPSTMPMNQFMGSTTTNNNNAANGNTISASFGTAGSSQPQGSSNPSKPDPFAGLGF